MGRYVYRWGGEVFSLMCVSDRTENSLDVSKGGAIEVRDVYQATNVTLDTHIGLSEVSHGDDCIGWGAWDVDDYPWWAYDAHSDV